MSSIQNEIVARTLARMFDPKRRNVEPVKRMVGGSGPRHAVHRFDIKGGISLVALMVENVCKNNALFEQLKKRG